MAIEINNMRVIFRALGKMPAAARGRLLILGEVQMLFSASQFVDLAKETGYALRSVPSKMDAHSLGQALGFETTDTLDINGKASLTLNLQHEMPADLLGQFNCLIDAGVLFWCFEPGSVLKNIFRLVKEDGLIVHITAVSGFYGRGYYNIHPLLLESFYLGNGCEYLFTSYYPRPKSLSLLQRIRGLLGMGVPIDEVSYSNAAGNVFLDEGLARRLSFGPKLRKPESEVITNNTIGTFAFKKGTDAEPQEPLLA